MGIVKRWPSHWRLGPSARALVPWALARPAVHLEEVELIRRVVIPNLTGEAARLLRWLDDGIIFRGNTRDLLPRTVYLFQTWEPALTKALRSRLRPG